MPWSKSDYPNAFNNLPDRVRSKAVAMANALLRDGYSDASAIRITLSRIKQLYYKGGEWKMSKSEDDVNIFEEKGEISNILEAEDQQPFMIVGVALVGDQTSLNKRYYPLEVVTEAVNRAQANMPRNILLMSHKHPEDVEDISVLDVVGKLTELYMEGNLAKYKAQIANSQKGKDIQELLRGKFIKDNSIRASGKVVPSKREDAEVDVKTMDFLGLDFVTQGGVKGAEVTAIQCSFVPENNESKGQGTRLDVLLGIEEAITKLSDENELNENLVELVEKLRVENSELKKELSESKTQVALLSEKMHQIEKQEEMNKVKEKLISKREGLSPDVVEILMRKVHGDTETEIKASMESEIKDIESLMNKDIKIKGVPPKQIQNQKLYRIQGVQ